MRVDVGYDVTLASQFLHCLDLCPHTGQSLLVRDSDSLEHGAIVAIDRLGKPHKINMCKSAFGQVSYNDHSVSANLDFRSWSKSSGGNGRSSHYARGVERRLTRRYGEGRIESRGHSRSIRGHSGQRYRANTIVVSLRVLDTNMHVDQEQVPLLFCQERTSFISIMIGWTMRACIAWRQPKCALRHLQKLIARRGALQPTQLYSEQSLDRCPLPRYRVLYASMASHCN